MYEPGSSKAGGTNSYGSMTYAGMKSMIYANVDKNDERVQAAYNWIRTHYTVETTPLMGNQGLFYYYQTMAKSLNAYGEEIITDNNNSEHQWRYELADQLLKTQNEEGFWVNENGRWWENNPVLVTAYSLLALGMWAGLWFLTDLESWRKTWLRTLLAVLIPTVVGVGVMSPSWTSRERYGSGMSAPSMGNSSGGSTPSRW